MQSPSWVWGHAQLCTVCASHFAAEAQRWQRVVGFPGSHITRTPWATPRGPQPSSRDPSARRCPQNQQPRVRLAQHCLDPVQAAEKICPPRVVYMLRVEPAFGAARHNSLQSSKRATSYQPPYCTSTREEDVTEKLKPLHSLLSLLLHHTGNPRCLDYFRPVVSHGCVPPVSNDGILERGGRVQTARLMVETQKSQDGPTPDPETRQSQLSPHLDTRRGNSRALQIAN